MEKGYPDRQSAWKLLNQYNHSDALLKHALAVEGVMRHFAGFYEGSDADAWAVAGLLHDLDYEQFPDQHCQKTAEILRSQQYEPWFVRAIISHGYGICSDEKPESDLERVLYTIDELTGLIHAAALMRPSRSVLDLELASLKKKFKTLSFAAGVNRDVVRQGSEWMGWELDKVMVETIQGMRQVAVEIGLAG